MPNYLRAELPPASAAALSAFDGSGSVETFEMQLGLKRGSSNHRETAIDRFAVVRRTTF